LPERPGTPGTAPARSRMGRRHHRRPRDVPDPRPGRRRRRVPGRTRDSGDPVGCPRSPRRRALQAPTTRTARLNTARASTTSTRGRPREHVDLGGRCVVLRPTPSTYSPQGLTVPFVTKTGPVGDDDEYRTSTCVQLAKNPYDVGANRRRAQTKHLGDLCIALPWATRLITAS